MLELNKLLYDECIKKELNFDKINELISKGANPLGFCKEYEGIVYDGIIYSLIDDNYQNLFKITKCFLENGMKIENASLVESYGEEVVNPLWSLAFKCDRDGLKTLELLLDNNLDIESVNILVDHIYTDYIFLEDDFKAVKNNKEYYLDFSIAMKMIMLCASYYYVIENSKFIRDMVEIENNNYDISNFKNYDDYYVDIEVKEAKNIIISFKSKKTNQVVWKIKETKNYINVSD